MIACCCVAMWLSGYVAKWSPQNIDPNIITEATHFCARKIFSTIPYVRKPAVRNPKAASFEAETDTKSGLETSPQKTEL